MVLLTLCKVLSWLWFGTTIAKLVAANMVLSIDCRAWCGDVPIPYPFGIGNDCSMNKSFEVHCNDSFNPPKLYLSSIQMELTAISLRGYARINNTVISSNCSNKLASSVAGVDLSSSPFRFSEVYNRFTATGCDNYATFVTYGSAQNYGSTVGGCLSVCNGSIGTTSGCYGLTCTSGCYGLTCCQTTIPPSIVSFKAYMQQVLHTKDGSGCKTAFMVDQSWLDEIKEESEISADKLSKLSYVPTVLQWGKDQGQCEISKPSEAFCSGSGYCWNSVDDRHLCVCSNPERELLELSYSYITRDCPEGDTCFNPKIYSCRLLCMYNPGSGGENCTCPSGYYSYGDSCYSEDWSFNSSNKTKIIIIGCASGFGSLLLILGLWGLYKIIKRQKESRLKQKFFKQNGGLLFQQQLCSTENNIEQTKIFASKDLEKATENYHINRIIGQGGQGTVYKGMLTDGRIVAIKKSKLMDASKISEFVNEVVILSQINHRNIVQLLGCCLETEVPLLVYEFIPNGTLFHYLHDEIEEYLVTWEMRLQIATEVANALSYLHSAAAIPIYHRDIKSSNILLDEKYRAKVADFGISKVIAFDQTHITTRVQGTFGYLDPEYFQSSQFTDKSDVYSFGVVLAELLTGQKPISTGRSAEERSLSTYFLLAMEDNRLIDILDYRIAEEGGKEEIAAVAQLARVCLNLNGRKRPTMKMVAVELETIRAKKGTHSVVHQDHKQVDCTTDVDFMGPWNVASSSTISSFNVTSPLLTSTF